MKQALHIFRKDVRFLRFEIAGLLLLTAAFTWVPLLSDVLEVAWLFVISRLIHAEAIPGERQYWLTRPYRPASLVGAKLLFIVVFISLPIAIAQTTVALLLGFPLLQELPGLLWTQALVLLCTAVPVVALASVTESLVPFLSTVLALVVIGFLGGSSLPSQFPKYFSQTPTSVGWIRDAIFGSAITGTAAFVVWRQYRDHRTLFNRLTGTIAFYVATAVYLWMPAAVPLTVESWLSPKPAMADGVRVAADPARRRGPIDMRTGRSSAYTSAQIPLPLVVSGIATGMEVRADQISVSFSWPDKTWEPARSPGVNARGPEGGEQVLDALIQMEPAVLAEGRHSPATIRGTAWLTIFGEPETHKILLKHGFQGAQDGLQCSSFDFEGQVAQTICRSFFRWPSRLVYAEGNDTQADFFNSLVSYSPFPASLDLNPLQSRWGASIHADEANIVTKKPLAHFRREFELRGVVLADFEKMPVAPPPGGR
jgi:hypothetical protein